MQHSNAETVTFTHSQLREIVTEIELTHSQCVSEEKTRTEKLGNDDSQCGDEERSCVGE